jgi:hypothetical protein
MWMPPLRAQVRNGRLVLDKPTDLPEGEVVYLRPVDLDRASDEEPLEVERRPSRPPDEVLDGIDVKLRFG